MWFHCGQTEITNREIAEKSSLFPNIDFYSTVVESSEVKRKRGWHDNNKQWPKKLIKKTSRSNLLSPGEHQLQL